MRRPLLALLLAACAPDETVSAHARPGATWVLEALGGHPFPARATLAFPAPGAVRGQGPCNAFSARQTVPYPWIRIRDVAITKRGCAHADAERLFLAFLAAAVTAEAAGDVLVLRDVGGGEAVFRAR